MKKTAVLIAALILSAFCSVPVFATGNDLPEEQTIGVFAKAVYTLPDGCYGAEEDDDGDYIVELPDGTEITLTPKLANPSLRIVIVPITEQDEQAYQWISLTRESLLISTFTITSSSRGVIPSTAWTYKVGLPNKGERGRTENFPKRR